MNGTQKISDAKSSPTPGTSSQTEKKKRKNAAKEKPPPPVFSQEEQENIDKRTSDLAAFFAAKNAAN